MWDDNYNAVFTIAFVSLIAVVIIFVGMRLRLGNAILQNRIQLLERENDRLTKELEVAKISPESARIIGLLTRENERMEEAVERRNVRVEIQEQYIEDLEISFDRLLYNLKTNHDLFGFDRPVSPEIKLTHLADQMGTHLSLDDVSRICFDLSIDEEDLRPGGKRAKIRELLQLLQSKRRLRDLGVWLHNNLPMIPWNVTKGGELIMRDVKEPGSE